MRFASSFAAGSAFATTCDFDAASVFADSVFGGAAAFGVDSLLPDDSDFVAAFGVLSVAAIELFADESVETDGVDFDSDLGAGAFATGAGFGSGLGSGRASAGGGAGVGTGARSFLSALFSALDGAVDSDAGSGEIGVAGGAGDVAFMLADRDDKGGGFIQSRTYGTATAPITPRTIRTRTTRNHVAAKMERGGMSS
ncbi:MAG TPA: hypothetical protein VNF03_18255 [Patescibacteria group bacterium]|nr:hypothetical protein [Patescibacteria group bacterium]